jgi:hypothetical protein
LAGILIKFNIKFQDLKEWNNINSEQEIHCKSGMLIVSRAKNTPVLDDFEFSHRNSMDSKRSRKSHDSGCCMEHVKSDVSSESGLKSDFTSTINTIHYYNYTANKSLEELIDFEAQEAWSGN